MDQKRWLYFFLLMLFIKIYLFFCLQCHNIGQFFLSCKIVKLEQEKGVTNEKNKHMEKIYVCSEGGFKKEIG